MGAFLIVKKNDAFIKKSALLVKTSFPGISCMRKKWYYHIDFIDATEAFYQYLNTVYLIEINRLLRFPLTWI
jgi:hypothetical protein